ncbi:L-allo-threonine aldolase [Cesiribacter andamanensis AMV16]|uniref:L-allo-threonine aldolase n=2 Tax=Cesiribacter TaxID=1133570 RepID=M7P0F0_9BACT|nr:L-allo-threonine aldolase [Cesiribacter andamanensis AMV16]
MLEAMMSAQVGDDVYGEDPTVRALEHETARRFGMETGLFCPSGTMTNQIAIKGHTQPGQEVICAATAHIYLYEGGGIALNSGCQPRLLKGDRGRLSPAEVEATIYKGDDVHYAPTALVSLENTMNKGGGSVYPLEQIAAIHAVCERHQIPLHLDGARVFNALVATGEDPREYGRYFSTISVCLSKGLGAPVGSVLLGSEAFIKKARRIRKAFGGGMRQAGYLAAAGLYALEHHVERLQEDHTRARQIGEVLRRLPWVREVQPVDTNIVLADLQGCSPQQVLEALAAQGVKGVAFGPESIRLVTHLQFDDAQLERLITLVKELRF